jgi:lysozyme
MIRIDKDPTLKTLLIQEALKARGLYGGNLDNWPGPRTEDALDAFQAQIRASMPATPNNLHRDISAEGLEMVKHFEGLFLKAYKCPAGVWTIGYGHTGLKHKDGTVYPGRTISQEEAEALLRRDMDYFEGRVARLITVPLADHEFAALVSFDFNTGGLADSTLRRMLNAGNRSGAAEQFLRWNKAAGKVLAGLTRRRQSERNLFLGIRPFLVK